jgi:hypothetical protein
MDNSHDQVYREGYILSSYSSIANCTGEQQMFGKDVYSELGYNFLEEPC